MNSSRRDILKGWLPALIWLALIAVESTTLLSAENTGRWLYSLFHFLTGVDTARFAVWNHYLRKTGHFVGYFTLSFLLFRAWRATLPSDGIGGRRNEWSIRWSRLAFFMAALVACLDEWHQAYLPSRTGTLRDVRLDSAAAFTAQIVIFLFLRNRSKQSAQSESPRTFPHQSATDNV